MWIACFSYLLQFWIDKLRRLKICVLKGGSRWRRKWKLFLYYRAFALRKIETNDEKYKEISRSSSKLLQKNPKVFKLPLFAIFKYKHSHGFLNTKIFYSDFFRWSNRLIIVYCNCTISPNATPSSQCIPRNHPFFSIIKFPQLFIRRRWSRIYSSIPSFF